MIPFDVIGWAIMSLGISLSIFDLIISPVYERKCKILKAIWNDESYLQGLDPITRNKVIQMKRLYISIHSRKFRTYGFALIVFGLLVVGSVACMR